MYRTLLVLVLGKQGDSFTFYCYQVYIVKLNLNSILFFKVQNCFLFVLNYCFKNISNRIPSSANIREFTQ